MTEDAAEPPLVLWFRAGGGKPWRAVAELSSIREAPDLMRGAGDFYIGTADPNEPADRTRGRCDTGSR